MSDDPLKAVREKIARVSRLRSELLAAEEDVARDLAAAEASVRELKRRAALGAEEAVVP